jgi:hypothetical protein
MASAWPSWADCTIRTCCRTPSRPVSGCPGRRSDPRRTRSWTTCASASCCDQGLRRLGDSQERWASGYLQIITALALFFQAKYAESAAAACASLEKKHELGLLVGTAYCLEALAMLALRQQRCERTAWLMGAADVLWERVGQRLGGTAIMEELH